jgi:hypothetical protein
LGFSFSECTSFDSVSTSAQNNRKRPSCYVGTENTATAQASQSQRTIYQQKLKVSNSKWKTVSVTFTLHYNKNEFGVHGSVHLGNVYVQLKVQLDVHVFV